MKTLVERCARPDVHKDVVVACVRVPGSEGGRQVEQHSFGSTTPEQFGAAGLVGGAAGDAGGHGGDRRVLEAGVPHA